MTSTITLSKSEKVELTRRAASQSGAAYVRQYNKAPRAVKWRSARAASLLWISRPGFSTKRVKGSQWLIARRPHRASA